MQLGKQLPFTRQETPDEFCIEFLPPANITQGKCLSFAAMFSHPVFSNAVLPKHTSPNWFNCHPINCCPNGLSAKCLYIESYGVICCDKKWCKMDSRCCLPVVTSVIHDKRDQTFLMELNEFIRSESCHVDCCDAQQYYTIYKQVFNKVISHTSGYRRLLSKICWQYEQLISMLERARDERVCLRGKMMEIISIPATLSNYQCRADDLQNKTSVIEKDNKRLRERLSQLRMSRQKSTPSSKPATQPLTSSVPAAKSDEKFKTGKRTIPGLSLEHATDVTALNAELDKVDGKLRELTTSSRTRYVPQERQDQLTAELTACVARKDETQSQVEHLRRHECVLRVALEAVRTYLNVQLPHQTVADAVLLALNNTDKLSGEVVETDEPCKMPVVELDTGAMLDYVERFNDFIDSQQYNKAAIHAANSPHGILRTTDTLHRLAEVSSSSRKSAQLVFCTALMSTVDVFQTRPSPRLSVECVRVALVDNNVDLLTHWLSQRRLTLSKELGDAIYENCIQDRSSPAYLELLSLAHDVYSDVSAHVEAMTCYLKQGRVNDAMQYAVFTERCTRQHLVDLLRVCPCGELATSLYETRVGDSQSPLLSLGIILHTLLQLDSGDTWRVAVHLLTRVGKYLHSVGLTSRLEAAVGEDTITSHATWQDIITQCKQRQQELEQEDRVNMTYSIELLSAAVSDVFRHRLMTNDNSCTEFDINDITTAAATDDDDSDDGAGETGYHAEYSQILE